MIFDTDDTTDRQSRERAPRLPGCHALRIGGPKSAGIGNSGPSSSSQTTESNDLRIAGAEGSINTSTKLDISGAGAEISFTDHGAIAGGLQLALRGVEGAQKTTELALSSTGGLLDGALQRAGQQSSEFTSAIKDIKTSDVRVLVVAGLAVVGLGAVMLFKKGA